MNTPQNCPHPQFAVVDGRCTHCGRHMLQEYTHVITDSIPGLSRCTDYDTHDRELKVRFVRHIDHIRGQCVKRREGERGLAVLSWSLPKSMHDQAHAQGFEVVLVTGSGVRYEPRNHMKPAMVLDQIASR